VLDGFSSYFITWKLVLTRMAGDVEETLVIAVLVLWKIIRWQTYPQHHRVDHPPSLSPEITKTMM
jgi:hypothetical protein